MASTMGVEAENGKGGQFDSVLTGVLPTKTDRETRTARHQLNLELELEDCREENRRLHSALKQMRGEMLELNRAVDRSALPEELRQLQLSEDLRQLQLIVEDQDKRLKLVYLSWSWRITAPLRALARIAGAH